MEGAMDVVQDINEEFSEVAVEHRNHHHMEGGGASRTLVEEKTRSRISSGSGGGELPLRTLDETSMPPFVPSSSEGSGNGGASHVVEEAGADLDAATASSMSDAPVPAAAARVLEDEDEEEEEEEEDDYEYYEDDDAFVSGFIEQSGIVAGAGAAAASASGEEKPVKIEEDMQVQAPSQSSSWREPSRQAVDMSLRAEKETTGGKRRLAQDLYRIMNQDTEKAGFDLEPVEDDMGKWRIRVFQFDPDSNLAKDMLVLGVPHIELEMKFPDDYPFQPPFVRVVRPRFKRQTGFVMSGAICMELLTKDGWNPVNDIESVIVSIRSLLVVGDGRLEAATSLPEKKYEALLSAAMEAASSGAAAGHPSNSDGEEENDDDDDDDPANKKRIRTNSAGDSLFSSGKSKGGAAVAAAAAGAAAPGKASEMNAGGSYSVSEAQAAYNHLSDYHKKKGWDTSGWWAKKG